jgi:site-specific recombinase XerD
VRGQTINSITLSNQRKQKHTKSIFMSVTLRKKQNSGGSTSLYLDVYYNGKRHKEYLKECKQVKPANPMDRQTNKAKMDLAKSIAAKRADELISSNYNIVAEHKSKVDFVQYFEHYISRYQKKDKRNMEGACNRFKSFMSDAGIAHLTMKQLTEDVVYQFADYLKANSEGEGAASYFARFKKMIKQAIREKIILSNPTAEISIKRDESLNKDVLTIEEIQQLASIPVTNKQVKNAFLFCCFTGLRWVDVVDLQWKHIDLNNKVLSKMQAKPDLKVSVNLNDTALSLLPAKGKAETLAFKLPSHTAALKTLRSWVNRADIQKHITWHCARHSFATNLIIYKTDVTIVSKLLGHTTLKCTQRYTHIADKLKSEAVNNLPIINTYMDV